MPDPSNILASKGITLRRSAQRGTLVLRQLRKEAPVPWLLDMGLPLRRCVNKTRQSDTCTVAIKALHYYLYIIHLSLNS